MQTVADPIVASVLLEANLNKAVMCFHALTSGGKIPVPQPGTPEHASFVDIQHAVHSGYIRLEWRQDQDGRVWIEFVQSRNGIDATLNALSDIQHRPKIKFVYTDAKTVEQAIQSQENITQ